MDDELMRVKEVADLMKVSTTTIYRLIAEAEIPATRVGKAWRIRRGDVDQYLKRGGWTN
ncbi:MAG: helix-turn-helix domain-containing protein [Actinomycetota bacterium]|jgi:excisionase family DNA binding protein|nr:helix-turn-helix domain-containing protein [Actinomycetota bacterium]